MTLIYFNIISIKIFYIENITEKVLCFIFYVYIFGLQIAINNAIVINKYGNKIEKFCQNRLLSFR